MRGQWRLLERQLPAHHRGKVCGGGRSRGSTPRFRWYIRPVIDRFYRPRCYNPPPTVSTNFPVGFCTVFINRTFDRWLIIILPVGLFAVLSVHGVMRLTPEPPSEFLKPDPTWDARRRAQEEELARGYWKSAVGAVQWEYGYGSTLPQGPPEDFRVEEHSSHTSGFERDPATRMRYWTRFRQVWILPHTWEKTYAWDVGWVVRTLEAVRNWFVDSWERVFWKG